MATPLPVRPAATIMVVRDGDGGVEVLMLRRNLNSDFVGGAYVFPGGGVDVDDQDAPLTNLTDDEASATLGLAEGGLAYYVAALRELFEEAGVLLCAGATPDAARLATLRAELNAGGSFREILRREEIQLDARALHYHAHWVTPVGPPRRYDTRFFLAVAPPDQLAAHDAGETIADTWVRPHDALAATREGRFEMIFPTIKNLETIADFASVDEVVAFARTPRSIERVEPRIVTRDGVTVIEMPDEA